MAEQRSADADTDLQFLLAMEQEVARLRAEGVVDEATADALRVHYRERLAAAQARAQVRVAGAAGSAADASTSRDAPSRLDTPAVLASLGVVLVFAAAAFVAWQTWSGLEPWERVVLISDLTVTFLALGLLLLFRSRLRITAIASLWLADALGALLVTTIVYAVDHTLAFELIAAIGAAAGVVAYALSAALVRHTSFAYAAGALLVIAANLATDWAYGFGFYGFSAWDDSRALGNLLLNAGLGAALVGAGLLLRAGRRSWSSPPLLCGVLTLTGAFVFMAPQLIPGDWDGLLALAAGLGAVGLGLGVSSRLLTAAGALGFLAATARLTVELIEGVTARAALLVAVGVLILAAAIVLERRRRNAPPQH